MNPSDSQAKQSRILDAALLKFTAYGFARTSMADIAGEADMSRPALYQYYANKEEIFRAMLGRILESAADKALSALETESDLTAQLDGFLQRWSGDLTEGFRATQHGSDLIEAKASYAAPVVDAANKRVTEGLRRHLLAVTADRAAELTELLLLSAIGMKYDEPSIAKLRRRLSTLASTVAESAGR